MRKVARALAAFAFALSALTACNNSDLPPATQFSPLAGTVTDSVTHQPIAGATVIVDTVLIVTTDDKGMFKVAKVPSGIVDYVVQAKGYADVSSTVQVEPGKTFQLNVAMQQPTPP
ncbi:MAG TPA: carboxypeptidase regulatory-like domain-containing protein [Candidatus Baltobacteraceae bacterium]|nr:carboxypeptidase regulatory-like domain-containing protein [Candidatus Baltobacteraceae bacterium]